MTFSNILIKNCLYLKHLRICTYFAYIFHWFCSSFFFYYDLTTTSFNFVFEFLMTALPLFKLNSFSPYWQLFLNFFWFAFYILLFQIYWSWELLSTTWKKITFFLEIVKYVFRQSKQDLMPWGLMTDVQLTFINGQYNT